jgi:hypothetical protein
MIPDDDDFIFSRPISAPPILEFSQASLINKMPLIFESGVADIREAPQYEKFYQRNQRKHQLPPPISTVGKFLPSPVGQSRPIAI